MDEIGTPLAGRTVAVFAGGLNYIGPKSNERLFETIINHSGALISELCPEPFRKPDDSLSGTA